MTAWKKHDWFNGDVARGSSVSRQDHTATNKISQERHNTLYIWLAEVSLRDLILDSFLAQWWSVNWLLVLAVISNYIRQLINTGLTGWDQ